MVPQRLHRDQPVTCGRPSATPAHHCRRTPRRRQVAFGHPSDHCRGAAGLLHGRPARDVARAVPGVKSGLSRHPRTWRRRLILELLVNLGGPCSIRDHRIEFVKVPSSKDRPDPRTSFAGYVVSLPYSVRDRCRDRVCRHHRGAVRPGSGPKAGVRRRAIGHVGVLEVAGRLSGVVEGQDASPRSGRGLPSGRYPSSAKPSGRDVLMANGHTTQSWALFWMPQFSDGWTAHGSLSELAPAIAF
jgi:hypothetical protein